MAENTLANPVQFIQETDPVSARLSSEAGFGTVGKLIGVGVALGAVVVGINVLNSNSGSESAAKNVAKDKNTLEIDCPTSSFSDVSTNASLYLTDSFLPKTSKLDSKDQADTYIRNLFDKDGPLAGKIDPMSLAAVDAIILKPSHDNKATDPKYDFLKAFDESKAAFSATGGLEAAEQACQVAKDTLPQTGQYNANWAQKGETVTEFVAKRNKKNQVINLDAKQKVTNDTLAGIEFRLRNSSKQVDGFTSVLVDGLGEIWVKGITVGSRGPSTNNGEQAAPAKPTTNGQAEATGQNQRQNGGNTGGGHNGTGNNSGVSRGNTPESNQNGPLPGPGQGPNGNGQTPEAAPGPGATPGTGSGGGTPEASTTSTTAAPAETTTTVERTTTTTAAPTTTEAPTTTAPPTTETPTTKGTNPCDPNYYNCGSSVQEASMLGGGSERALAIASLASLLVFAGNRRRKVIETKSRQGVEL